MCGALEEVSEAAPERCILAVEDDRFARCCAFDSIGVSNRTAVGICYQILEHKRFRIRLGAGFSSGFLSDH